MNMPTSNQSPMRHRADIEHLVKRVFQLQSLPDAVLRISEVLNDNAATVDDVAREMARDVAFSAQVLKLVNSGFYGFKTPVTSLSHATVLLGFNVMRTLVMTASVGDMITGSFAGLWQHSVACARTCTLISRRLGGDEPEELGAVGLLHDIGKVVFAEYLKPEFAAMQQLVEQEDILLIEAERRVTGMDHGEVGEMLLRRWKLPEATVMPIAGHHAFNKGNPYAARSAVLCLADIIVRAAGCGSGGDRRIPPVNPDVMDLLGMDAGALKSVMDECLPELVDFMD